MPIVPHTKDESPTKLVERLFSHKIRVQHNLNIPWDHFHLAKEPDIILLTHVVSGSQELFSLPLAVQLCRQGQGAVSPLCSLLLGRPHWKQPQVQSVRCLV